MVAMRTAVELVAQLMAVSARTAPKARGEDALEIQIIGGTELSVLAEEMRRFGKRYGKEFFVRDAGNVESSDACILIGSRQESVAGIDCAGCGYSTCKEMLEAQRRKENQNSPFEGPNCIIRMADIGIALGSAVKTASLHNIDNRIMYSVGVGARSLGWLPGCGVGYGIPLKASGKNIYFDRQG
jgi:uncharacterized ferredoxin-like protein